MNLSRHAAVALLAFAPAGVYAADVRLFEDASPGGTIVRLGDVATVSSASSGERDRLERTPLMPTPAPGTRQYLSATTIRELLAAQGVSPSAHRFSGAFRVRVGTPAPIDAARPLAAAAPSESWRPANRRQSATGFRSGPAAPRQRTTTPRRLTRRDLQRVEENVRDAVQSFASESATGDPLLVRSVRLTETAARALVEFESRELRVESDDAVQVGEVVIYVTPVNRTSDSSHRVVASVISQPFRLVAAAPMARGALVTASSVVREPVPLDEIDRAVDGQFETLDAVVGYETSRALRAGDLLTTSNCSPPLMVRRGDEVAIYSGGGGVRVKLFGMARDAGRRGDLVGVEAYDRSERFNARVVGPREVAVLSAGLRLADFSNEGGLR